MWRIKLWFYNRVSTPIANMVWDWLEINRAQDWLEINHALDSMENRIAGLAGEVRHLDDRLSELESRVDDLESC
jgi:hypothetical protein